jgi:hypothetical protein
MHVDSLISLTEFECEAEFSKFRNQVDHESVAVGDMPSTPNALFPTGRYPLTGLSAKSSYKLMMFARMY